MRLYLTDEEKITTFTLPEKVSESFLFSYTPKATNIEIYLVIYSRDGNWFLKNSMDINIDDSVEDILLLENSSHILSIKDVPTKFQILCSKSIADYYDDIIIDQNVSIGFGSSNTNHIICNYPNISPAHFGIYPNAEGQIVLQVNKENTIYTYINNRVAGEITPLHCGDVIFSNGIMFIWMNSFLRVYHEDRALLFNSVQIMIKEKASNDQYLNYNMKENNESLYSENDLFFRQPRLTYAYDTETITIDQPPNTESKDEIPVIFSMTAGLTMVASSAATAYNTIKKFKKGQAEKDEFIIALVLAGIMLLCSFVLPKIMSIYNKHLQKKKSAKARKKYEDYLAKKKNNIDNIKKNESQILFENNPSSVECYNIITSQKLKLWARDIVDQDFLKIRVGLGNFPSAIDIKCPTEKFEIDENDLLAKAIEVGEFSKELENVPVCISLTEFFISSIVCSTSNEQEYINGILLQLLCQHNPKNLKIIFLTDKQNKHKWDYLKLVPHIYSDDKQMRYYATNDDEARKIINEIESIYNERLKTIKDSKNEINDTIDRNNYFKSLSPYYLIFTDNFREYKDIDFLNELLTFDTNVGFSLVMIENSIRNLPSECKKYIYVTDNESVVFEKTYTKGTELKFTVEKPGGIYDMNRIARELANVPIQTAEEAKQLPPSLTFLEMYNVGNIEQLNILNRWATSNPIISLSCPIGVQATGEPFKLDLHEKAHGPHGLIAGSTGSGKSEFIITYILSMCINYHPYDVQFILIDYKGGGLAGAFENRETGIRVPHLAGTITNLDVSEMNRTLVSINSELKRRQQKFNEAREKLGESTMDIYKYQKLYKEGQLTEPIPHLLIISDEFAELKSQQPEFMDELISTARIGRSLGVHLILATQKPSGVVNDQIWSNSKFRICLKVQTVADSNEMLKRPEAASIKETGRFYLQVGYDELFELGQSGWTGANYIPSEKVIKQVDDAINFIDNTGDVIKSANNVVTTTQNVKSEGDQLTNIVKYLNKIAGENNIQNSKLWLDSLPAEIFLQSLIQKYNYTTTPYIINPIIGEYDDPVHQKQGLYTIDLTNTGNTLIYGIPGSGKENLLTTMITSICTKHTTEEVNIYIMDFGAETFTKFKNFPQVGDILFISDKEKINALYNLISKEIEKRKPLFANYMGSYVNFIKASEKKLPNILIFMQGYDTFSENLGLVAEKWERLFKEGPKFGITFIITNSSTSGIRMRVQQYFANKLTLKLAETSDYRMVIDAPRKLVPAKYFGRGILKADECLEFQTAYVSKVDEIIPTLDALSKQLNAAIKTKAPKIPVLPDFVTIDKFVGQQYELSAIPIGVSKAKLTVHTFDFANQNFTPILSTNVSEHMHFVYGLVELLKQVPNSKIRIIDVLKLYKNSQGVDCFNKDYDTLIQQIKLEILDDAKIKRTNIFIIMGLGAFKNNVTQKTQKHFEDVFNKLNEYEHNKFIIYDDYNSYRSLESNVWFNKNISGTNGIWLGDNVGTQMAIKMPNLSSDERKISFNQMAFSVENSTHTIIKYIVDKEFDNEK